MRLVKNFIVDTAVLQTSLSRYFVHRPTHKISGTEKNFHCEQL